MPKSPNRKVHAVPAVTTSSSGLTRRHLVAPAARPVPRIAHRRCRAQGRSALPAPPGPGDHEEVFQVRIHGRVGQGVVAAAELLSKAAFDEGHHAQAFPSFVSERMGAPVVSFCRIDARPIRSHEPVTEPDAVIVQDATLVHQVDLFRGIDSGTYVLVNTSTTFAELGLAELAATSRPGRLVTCPATAIALEYLGRQLPNVALLGGFAALTGRISLGALERAVGERFGGAVGAANAAAARAAHDFVTDEVLESQSRGEVAGARAD